MCRRKWKSTSRTVRASDGCSILSTTASPFTGLDSCPSELKTQPSFTAIRFSQASSSIFERFCKTRKLDEREKLIASLLEAVDNGGTRRCCSIEVRILGINHTMIIVREFDLASNPVRAESAVLKERRCGGRIPNSLCFRIPGASPHLSQLSRPLKGTA